MCVRLAGTFRTSRKQTTGHDPVDQVVHLSIFSGVKYFNVHSTVILNVATCILYVRTKFGDDAINLRKNSNLQNNEIRFEAADESVASTLEGKYRKGQQKHK